MSKATQAKDIGRAQDSWHDDGVSPRTIGRDCASPPVTTPSIRERALALIAASADLGSTRKEREAAVAWLQDAARDAHQVEGTSSGHRQQPERTLPTPPRVSTSRNLKARVHARRPTRTRTHWNGSATPMAALPDAPGPLMVVQRILHRTALLEYVLAAENRTGAR